MDVPLEAVIRSDGRTDILKDFGASSRGSAL
jgi:hypothetical protein